VENKKKAKKKKFNKYDETKPEKSKSGKLICSKCGKESDKLYQYNMCGDCLDASFKSLGL